MGLGEGIGEGGYGSGGYGAGQGEGAGGQSGNMGWSLFWLIVLLLVGFWFAGACAFLYIIFNMFTACCEGLAPFNEILLKGVQFTGTCAQAMVKGTSINEAFK